MRKRIKISVVAIATSLTMISCGMSTADKAVEQGKLAMAAFEYETALESFKLAIAEGNKDEEISNMVTIIDGYLEAKSAYEMQDYEKALECIDSIPAEYESQSINVDVITLKEDTETAKKQAEAEKAKKEAEEKAQKEALEKAEKEAQEKAEKEAQEKAEQEAKQKEEETIQEIINRIYEVTGDNPDEVFYNLEEKGYMTDDMVDKYYCFSELYCSGEDSYMSDNNIIADRLTLELFYYDSYYGMIPLEEFYQ